MYTVEDVWNKFASQDELAQEYLKVLNTGFKNMQQNIISHYGYENQLKKLVEELRELQDAIIYENNESHIQEEMADVLNLIEQIIEFKQWNENIYSRKWFKVKRQLKRIEHEKKGK